MLSELSIVVIDHDSYGNPPAGSTYDDMLASYEEVKDAD